MKGIAFLPGFISAAITLGIIVPSQAQVTSDSTTNTTVNSTGNNFNILNGIQKGNNLFHSFKEFSIPTGSSATFQTKGAIENIINRVTGGNVSNIDGLIKSQGSANLFLINPAGIVFGENARLDIGGSFLGTTAESLLFEDGFEFSAVNAQTESLLTISVPLGLQMGQKPGDITVQGTGYTIATENPFIVTSNVGLRVTSGNTLALIGGNITLDGGLIAADSGLIELASITEGFINFNQTSEGWQFGYETVPSFGNLELLSLSLVDVRSQGGGSVKVRGKNISLGEGSRIFHQTQGLQSGGIINLTASNSVEITGTDADTGELGSVLQTETIGAGNAADILISSQQLLLSQGAGINSRTFSPARGGNITINATDSIQLKEFSSINPSNGSDITTSSFSSGNAGDLNVSTKELAIEGQQLLSVSLKSGNGGNVNLFTEQLKLIDGGVISSTALEIGQGGDLNINAESIELIGVNLDNFTASALSTGTIGEGEAGNLTINTGKLLLRDGGRVDASTFNSGLAGSVSINASESVEISGTVPGSVNPSLIISSANILDPFLRQFLGLPDLPTGNSGNVTINTPVLKVTDGAQVTVKNDGTANAGTLQINAENIFLNNEAGITASTKSGEGGNIKLNLKSDLILRNNSLIDTEAVGTGNGGNITINSPIIAGFEDSDIIANAVEGNGGNINITTQGIFGLELRDRLTPNSDITASSEFGVNGTVEINNITIDPNSGIVSLPTEVTDPSQQIASGCSSNNKSSFVSTGRGGMPQNPKEGVDLNRTWSDIRDLSAFRQQRNNSTVEITQISNKPAIVEATGFIRNENGEIELVALENIPLRNKQVSNCSG